MSIKPVLILSAHLVLCFIFCLRVAHGQTPSSATESAIAGGSLAEIKNKRRALLIVTRSSVLAVGDQDKTIIAEAYRASERGRNQYRHTFGLIARRLNKHIRKHGDMSAVERIADAEYIILFDLIQYRSSLGSLYPYGQLYVIVTPTPGTEESPRVVWRTEKIKWADDAAKDLLKSINRMRDAR